MIILLHQNNMNMNISFNVKKEEKIILILTNMSDENWKKFERKKMNYWNTDWVAFKFTKRTKFLLDWQSHIVLSTKIFIVHCFHFLFYLKVWWMIWTMLFKENHSDMTNDDGSEQKCLFENDIKFLLTNKLTDHFNESVKIKKYKQLFFKLEKKLQCYALKSC